MRKRLAVIVLVLALALTTVSLAVASDSEAMWGCPDNFQLHKAMVHQHGGNGQHLHVGNDDDLNGDGWICGKHVSEDEGVHVHIDNRMPLR